MPETPWVAPGVAAGVAGVAGAACCGAPAFIWFALSPSAFGGVISPAPPGKESEPGAMKVFACAAFSG